MVGLTGLMLLLIVCELIVGCVEIITQTGSAKAAAEPLLGELDDLLGDVVILGPYTGQVIAFVFEEVVKSRHKAVIEVTAVLLLDVADEVILVQLRHMLYEIIGHIVLGVAKALLIAVQPQGLEGPVARDSCKILVHKFWLNCWAKKKVRQWNAQPLTDFENYLPSSLSRPATP